MKDDYDSLPMKCWSGDIGAIYQAVHDKEDLDEVDLYGRTTLITAAGRGLTEIVELLLAQHVEVNASDNEGLTALHFATMNDPHPIIAGLILRNGGNVSARDAWGNTPLCRMKYGYYNKELRDECIRILLRYGADPDEENDYEISPRELSKSIVGGEVDWERLIREANTARKP